MPCGNLVPFSGNTSVQTLPRSAKSSSTSRYESEKRKYQPIARRMTSGSNWRHLNRPQTEESRTSIQPAYHGRPAKLQHFRRPNVLPRQNQGGDMDERTFLLRPLHGRLVERHCRRVGAELHHESEAIFVLAQPSGKIL